MEKSCRYKKCRKSEGIGILVKPIGLRCQKLALIDSAGGCLDK